MSYVIVLALMSQWTQEPYPRGDNVANMRYFLTMQHVRAGENEQARRVLESIVAEKPNFRAAHHWLGRLALEREDWADARNHLEIAIGLYHRYPSGSAKEWVFLAKARDELGDRSGVMEALDIAIDSEPSSIPLRMERARIALDENDLWNALKHLQAASRTSRDFRWNH